MKKCRECGAELKLPTHKKARFCGWECYTAWKAKKSRAVHSRKSRCIVCGKIFCCGKQWRPTCGRKCGHVLVMLKQPGAQDYKALPPKEPTDYPPGSIEKIIVMRERVSRGESPFHPDDNCSVMHVTPRMRSIVKLRRLLMAAGISLSDLQTQKDISTSNKESISEDELNWIASE